MATKRSFDFTTPVGRLVGGSFTPRTTNDDGTPKLVKSGARAGQPTQSISFGVAFAKTPGAQHWAQEAWLRPLYDLACESFPQGQTQRQDFSWKITDGDSSIPNLKGNKPCDNEGWPGHWVIWFSGSTMPKFCNASGTAPLTADAFKLGYFVQVMGNATDNLPSQSPGMYVNHAAVALAGFGAEIYIGPDVSKAGFGQAPLPAGASVQPLAGLPGALPGAAVAPLIPGMQPGPNLSAAYPGAPVMPGPISAAPAMVGAPSLPGGLPPLPGGSVQMQPGVAPIVVAPNPAFIQVPGAAPAMAAPGLPLTIAQQPAVVAAHQPQRYMQPSANGVPYEKLIQDGWTDALLVQHGHMVIQ